MIPVKSSNDCKALTLCQNDANLVILGEAFSRCFQRMPASSMLPNKSPPMICIIVFQTSHDRASEVSSNDLETIFGPFVRLVMLTLSICKRSLSMKLMPCIFSYVRTGGYCLFALD